jgi:hypothetical protein
LSRSPTAIPPRRWPGCGACSPATCSSSKRICRCRKKALRPLKIRPRIFLHLSWGGVYSGAERDAARIRDCFSPADAIVPAAQAAGRFLPGERPTVVGSSFYGSYWLPPGKTQRNKGEAPRARRACLLKSFAGWQDAKPPRRPTEDSTAVLQAIHKVGAEPRIEPFSPCRWWARKAGRRGSGQALPC